MAKSLPYVKADSQCRQRLTALVPTLSRLSKWLVKHHGYLTIGERYRDHSEVVADIIGEAALLFPYCASQTADDRKALSRAINVALSRHFRQRRRAVLAMLQESPLTEDIACPEPPAPPLAELLATCPAHVAAFGLDIAYNGLDDVKRNPRYIGVFKHRMAALRAAVIRQLEILLD
jgi:hypothetical protein